MLRLERNPGRGVAVKHSRDPKDFTANALLVQPKSAS